MLLLVYVVDNLVGSWWCRNDCVRMKFAPLRAAQHFTRMRIKRNFLPISAQQFAKIRCCVRSGSLRAPTEANQNQTNHGSKAIEHMTYLFPPAMNHLFLLDALHVLAPPFGANRDETNSI